MRMRLAGAVVGLGLIVGASPAAVQDDHETTVRLAYAKLAFISQIGGINAVFGAGDASGLDSDVARRRLEQYELQFTIKDLRTGKVDDLKATSLRFSSLVTAPEAPVLQIAPGTWTVNVGDVSSSAMIATAQWQDRVSVGPEDWSMPAGNAIRMIDPKNRYSEYAAFAVVVKAAQRSQAYHAAFLFGSDERGQPDVLPMDNIVGATPLIAVIKKSVLPGPVLDRLVLPRQLSEFFIEHIRANTGCMMEPDGKVCCDLQKLRCGVR